MYRNVRNIFAIRYQPTIFSLIAHETSESFMNLASFRHYYYYGELFTYNSVVDGRIDKVVENGDVDSSDDETFSGLTCLVQWLSHASEIIVESPTMDLGGKINRG